MNKPRLALIGTGGNRLHSLLRLTAPLGVAAQGHAAAWRLDQNAERVFDEGDVAAVRAGHCANGSVGQGDEFRRSTHAGSSAWVSAPERLIRAALSMRTGTIWPIR